MNCKKCRYFDFEDTNYAKYKRCIYGQGKNGVYGYITRHIDVENEVADWCPLRKKNEIPS